MISDPMSNFPSMATTLQPINKIILFLLITSMPAILQAQQNGPWIFKANGGLVHQANTDLADDDGSFAVDRWFVSGGVEYVWDQRTSLGFSVGGGKSDYEFEELAGIGVSAPWGEIADMRASVTGRFGFGKSAVVLISPTIRFNGEDGAGSSDSLTYGVFAAMAWRLNQNLTIGPGVGVFTRLEDSVRIFPVLAIDWDISDRWNLSTGRGLASSQGPGLTLSYKLNEDWSFGLAGRYEDIEFRLDNEGPAAGGVGRDQSFPLVAIATLKPNPMLTLSVFAGLELAGEIRLNNDQDITIEESSYDPAPLFGATFEFRY